MQQVEELAARRPRVDVAAVGQQLHAAAAAGRVEETDAEALFQRFQNQMELVHREAAAAKVGEHQQLEQLDGRVAALGVPAGLGFVRSNRGGHQAALVPQLQ